MKRFIIGVILTSIVFYAWGFVYWGGLIPYQTKIWLQAEDDVAAGAALVEHFPEDGTYFIPNHGQDEETMRLRFDRGPIAFVHMLSSRGRPMVDPAIMGKGFLCNVVFILLLGVLLQSLAPALPTYGARVRFVVLAGLACAILVDIGAAAWWEISWSWKLYQAFYTLSAWVVCGLVMGLFVGRPAREES